MPEAFRPEKIGPTPLPSLEISPESGLKLVSRLLLSLPEKFHVNIAAEKLDEESLYILGAAYGRPERLAYSLGQLEKHKPHVADPAALWRELETELRRLDESLSPTERGALDPVDDEDASLRSSELPQTKARLEKILDFFRPDASDLDFKKIVLATTDAAVKPDSGRAIRLGPELIIVSHRENRDNLDHEFMHSFINPLVEKLGRSLTEKQKSAVTELAGAKLKQDYGTGWYSLLCEELIRTYNDCFKLDKKPRDLAGFEEALAKLDGESFRRMLAEEPSLNARCSALGITDIEGMKAKAKEYFERYETNKLRDVLYGLYTEYAAQAASEKTDFGSFIAKNLPDSI